MLSALLVSGTAVGGVIAASAYEGTKEFVAGEIDKDERDFILNNPLKPLYTPNDRYYSSKQYVSHNHLGDIESVWDTYKGEGTKIAVIDTGINYKHPDFLKSDGTTSILPQSKYYHLNSTQTKVVYETAETSGYDILLHDWDDYYDEWDSHGTNSAGCAAARTGDGVGTIGIAPEADLLVYKTDMYLSSISYAIQDAANQGADVINMSLGAYAEDFLDGYGEQQEGDSSTATYLQNIIDYAHNKGVIVVAAAGNEKTNHHSYPACNTHVIGVGALNNNSSTTAADFSNFNYQSETDPSGNHNVDVMAPGYVYTPDEGGTRSSPNYSAYCNTQGTSFASPIVAGAAALWKQKNPTGTPDQFEEDLYSSSVDIGNRGFDYKFGNGRLDVKALLSIAGLDRVSLKDSEKTIYTGSDHAITLDVTYSSGPITWSSNNTSVATVDGNGKVTGLRSGTATITARVGDATAECVITVKNYIAATSIKLAEESGSVPAGETYQIQASIEPNNASETMILYESLDEEIATVDDNGLVTGLKEGTTDIYLMGADDTEALFTITVTEGTQKVYSKLLSAPSNWAGDYLFVYEGSDSSYAFDGSLTTLDAPSNTIAVTPVNGKIPSNETTNASKFVVAPSKNSGKYTIKSSSGYYIGGVASTNTISTSTSNPFDCEFSYDYGKPVVKSNTYLTYNTSSGQERFRFMKSDNGNTSLYKLVAGSSEKPEKVLSSITASYSGGDVFLDGELDQSKITVTAHYSEPSYYPDEVVSGWTISGFSSATTGVKTVNVSYEGKSTTFTVNVTEDPSSPLVSISIEGVPETMKFREEFNKDDVVVTAHYQRKSDADVTSKVTLPNIDTNVLGEGAYEVSYTENGVTKKASITYTVTNKDATPSSSSGTSTWNLVTASDQIKVGDTIVIASATSNVAMSTTQNSNNRGETSITKNASEKTINITDSVQKLTLVSGTKSGTYGLYTGNGYLTSASSSSNYLRTSSTLNDNSSFAISISSENATITAQGSYSRNIIKYNSTSNLFSCYSSGQSAVSLYKLNNTGGEANWSGEDQAKAYSYLFLLRTKQGCLNQSKSELTLAWGLLKLEYNYMIDDAKDAFVTSSASVIVEARTRYSLIVSKYGLEDFVADSSGNKLSINNAYISNGPIDMNTPNVMAISVTGLALTGALLLKKKQKKKKKGLLRIRS